MLFEGHVGEGCDVAPRDCFAGFAWGAGCLVWLGGVSWRRALSINPQHSRFQDVLNDDLVFRKNDLWFKGKRSFV